MKDIPAESSGGEDSQPTGSLGAFGGVFAPSILTILGIIFYLRAGYVVGEVGLLDALIIISVCYAISILTSFSLSAIATSMPIKGGGFYYVISRTIGFEFGGALGVVLFLSVSIGIAFYAIGLGEVVVGIGGVPDWISPRAVAIATIVVLFAFAWAGADVATRLQYVVMAIVFASILSIGWGGVTEFRTDQLWHNRGTLFASEGGTLGFWAAFALFFPAITGFTQGLNMSGDLRRPTRDIPLGTLAAVILSYGLYAGLAILVAGNATSEELRSDYLILEKISLLPWIVTAGVIAATASSAMASFLGAPRIAQALGQDGVFPGTRHFAKGAGPSNNPRRAVALSGAIAIGAVAVGDLNFLAPIITMFFLASYALLNYATFFVAHAASPSFRPSFRVYHKYLSFLGGLLCIGAMLAIDFFSAGIAVLAMFAVHQYLQGRVGRKVWADSQRAYGFQRIREQLFSMAERPAHPGEWRPLILILSKDEERRQELLRFSEWVEGRSGLTSLVSVIETGGGDRRDREDVKKSLRNSIEEAGVEAFPLAVSAPSFETGFSVLLQSYGVGPLKANTVLVNWLEQLPPIRDERAKHVYGHNLGLALGLGYNVIILHCHSGSLSRLEKVPGEKRRIDIWWAGGETSNFKLLMAYLTTRTPDWTRARLRVLAAASSDRPGRTERKIAEMLEAVRINAEVELIERITEEEIHTRSADADLTFFPGIIREKKIEAGFELDLNTVAGALPLVAICIAGESVDLDPDPDEVETASEADRG